ncbi:hypothetical protein AGDE_05959 [Angomonas deanei]|uniref:Uncharacterized protein n=1 Tax=Angomonas deanei TaxID=59799 RepID=A0A7G2BZZ3_9TRYP|nr:hypothetical protein AGDE_05959 [Angomonas deanei]CAD2213098.1 hypothetical protein, conserved [Angomonas deanei]|eukprot:EPY37974.1 hypothetical protein AGDE_05959 [Angomonas deanei]
MSVPLSYKEIRDTVERYLTRCSNVQGWHIDASQNAEPDKINCFPFASQAGTGFHLAYEDGKSGLNVRCSLSNCFHSITQFLPVVKYSTKVNSILHKVCFDAPTATLKYNLEHEVFTASAVARLSDGGAGIYAVSTRIAENAYAGVAADYCPKRSGLRDLTLMATQLACPNFKRGDIVARYSLLSGLGIHLRVPVSNLVDVAVISENNRFIVGCQGRSPCGASISVNTNISDGTGTITAIRNVKDIWKLTLTCTAPLVSCSPCVPRFGVKFTNQDVDPEDV